MVVFVDLDGEEDAPMAQLQYAYNQPMHGKPEWHGERVFTDSYAVIAPNNGYEVDVEERNELSTSTKASSRYTFRNAMTEALGCYP